MEGKQNRIALAVAGDNENAKEIVVSLINATGFDSVDAGLLSQSWRQQPGTPAYCTELNIPELKKALAKGIKEDAAHLRDFVISKIMERTIPPSHKDMVELNRSLFPENTKE